MRNVNARVPGLVGLLDLITDGRAPDTLSGIIQPQIDLSPFFLFGKRQRRVDIAPTVGLPTGLARLTFALAPAAGEIWLVEHFSIQFDSQASRFAGYASMFPTAGANPLDIQLGAVGDNGGAGAAVAIADRPFILAPGFTLRGIVTQNPAAATMNGAATVIYTPVRL